MAVLSVGSSPSAKAANTLMKLIFWSEAYPFCFGIKDAFQNAQCVLLFSGPFYEITCFVGTGLHSQSLF